jgi:hypothetical protein
VADLSLKMDPQPHLASVFLQVRDEVIARHPAAGPQRNRQARQTGEPARGLQVQPVVVVASARAY